MARMTKAQLVDENIALRHNLSLLEAKVDELSRRLFAERGGSANCTVVATYTKRDGSHWNKVRIGWNSYAHRRVS